MEKIILIGCGGHAGVIVDILEQQTKYSIIGILDKGLCPGEKYRNYSVLGGDEKLNEMYNSGVKKVALGVGGFTGNEHRTILFEQLKSIGYQIINIIHSSCIIQPSVTLGEGVVMYPGCTLNSYAKIGNNVILAAGAVIDHEAVIEDHALISTGVAIGGYAKIGSKSVIGIGATVVAGVQIGQNALVAAGAVVTKNIPLASRVAGVPAKPFSSSAK